MSENISTRKYFLFQILVCFVIIVSVWESWRYTIYWENPKRYAPVDDSFNRSCTKQQAVFKDRFPHTEHSRTESDENTEERSRKLDALLKHMMEQHPPPIHHRFNFNTSHSHGISLTRDMPDIRSDFCKDIHYDITKLPRVSVVSPFYNEDVSMLLRYVHSLLRHTPRDLLREIILVDDKSTLPYLGTDLDKYLSILDPRIVVMRNKKREGLTRTRIIGAKAAKEEVIVFLDSHMEFNVGWLEPMVARLASQSKLVVQPHVVTIHGMEKGQPEPLMRSAFGWDLRMTMYFLPAYLGQTVTSPDDPIPTPGLVGCAIAVKRDHFFESGAFDPYLELWGAEHLELAFRTWMCGGRVEVVPCSKVGHLFRRPPYLHTPEAMAIVINNIVRVADIWMDGYKHIVFAALRGCCQQLLHLPVFTDNKRLNIHKKMRRKSHCKNFNWFLTHVMPEAHIPAKDAVYFGEVTNVLTSYALAVTREGRLGVTAVKLVRGMSIPELYFTIDKHGRFVHMKKCVYFDNDTAGLKLNQEKCYNTKNIFSWSLNPGNGGRIMYLENGRCLCLVHVLDLQDSNAKNGAVLLEPCDFMNQAQLWKFPYKFDWN